MDALDNIVTEFYGWDNVPPIVQEITFVILWVFLNLNFICRIMFVVVVVVVV
jgi:uncharacterized membrane protein